MNRYRATYPITRDDATIDAGDTALRRVNMLDDPATLPADTLSEARNVRLIEGVALPRGGAVVVPTRTGSYFPGVSPVDLSQRIPFGTLNGYGAHGDINNQPWVIVAANDRLYARSECSQYTILPHNAKADTFPLGDTVTFVQAGGQVVAVMGKEVAPLIMDSIDAGFRDVTAENSGAGQGTGTFTIPNFEWAIEFAGRLVGLANDTYYASDIGNLTRYALPEAWQLSRGKADPSTGIFKFNDTTLVLSRERSLYALTNLLPDSNGDFTSAIFSDISTTLGFVEPRTVTQMGKRLVGLSRQGVLSIVQTALNKLQVESDDDGNVLVLSTPFRPLIDRINWRYQNKARGIYFQGRYYLAVPLDEGEVVLPDLFANIGAEYDTGSWQKKTLMLGRKYRLTFGGNDTGATCGAQEFDPAVTLTVDFTATSETLTLTGDGLVTATLQPLYQGVNNAVLVFNEINNGWESWDTGDCLMVREWLITRYNGEDRLHFLGEDGFERIFEEGDYDEVLVESLAPMVEVVVNQSPVEGQTIRVNGGTLVTAKESGGNTNTGGPAAWGARTLAIAEANLQGGYGDDLWDAPDTTVTTIDGGVRFTSVSGAVPVVTLTGDWAETRQTFEFGTGRDLWRQAPEFVVISRGLGAVEPTRTVNVSVLLAGANPRYSISVVNEGVAEETSLAYQQTRDRRKYSTTRQDYRTDNSDDDFGDAKRLDYSILLNDQSDLTLGSGLLLDELQEWPERFPVVVVGRYAQVKIVNTQGALSVRALGTGQRAGPRRMGQLR